MPKENLEAFKTKMQEQLASIPAIERTKQESYDLEIFPHEVTPKLLKELELLEPFGMGNEKPIFKMKGIRLASFDLLKDIHVRWSFATLDKKNPCPPLKGISFNYVGSFGKHHPRDIFEKQNQGSSVTAYFTLGINRFNGNEYIQLMVNRIELDEI